MSSAQTTERATSVAMAPAGECDCQAGENQTSGERARRRRLRRTGRDRVGFGHYLTATRNSTTVHGTRSERN